MMDLRCVKKIAVFIVVLSLVGGSVQAAGTVEDVSQEIEASTEEGLIEISDYERELEEYRRRFIGMYTSNAFDDVEPQLDIEELEVIYYEQKAGLTKYMDLSGKCMRYRINLCGETMQTVINYYF